MAARRVARGSARSGCRKAPPSRCRPAQSWRSARCRLRIPCWRSCSWPSPSHVAPILPPSELPKRPLYEIEAWDLVLEVPDRDRAGQMKLLLDHVSFKALPGDFIALMGPSGSGKTTLLLTLNGYLRPTAGQVRINGEDLHSIYDAL